MKYITTARQSIEVALGVSKVGEHVGPGAFNAWTTVPETEVLLKNRLTSKNNIGHVNHLLRSHGGQRVFSEVDEIVNGVEHGVNGLGNVIMVHVVNGHFLSLDLLGG